MLAINPFILGFLLCFTLFAKTKDVANQTAKPAFQKLLKIISSEPVNSSYYQSSVESLERVHKNISLKNLEILANTYQANGDSKNQVKVLQNIILTEPENYRGYFLLGNYYKNLYEKYKKNKCPKFKLADKIDSYYLKAVENLGLSISKSPKNELLYTSIYPLITQQDRILLQKKVVEGYLQKSGKKSSKKRSSEKSDKKENPLSKIKLYTDFLGIIKDASVLFKNPIHKLRLCEAYFKENLTSYAKKICRDVISKLPYEGKGYFYYYQLNEKFKEKKLVYLASSKFTQDVFIQREVGKLLLKTQPQLALNFLKKSVKLDKNQPEIQNTIATRLFDEKKYEQSLDFFKEACFRDYSFAKDIKKRMGKLRFSNKALFNKFETMFSECYVKHKARRQMCENFI